MGVEQEESRIGICWKYYSLVRLPLVLIANILLVLISKALFVWGRNLIFQGCNILEIEKMSLKLSIETVDPNVSWTFILRTPSIASNV